MNKFLCYLIILFVLNFGISGCNSRVNLAEEAVTLKIITGTTPAAQDAPTQLREDLKMLFMPLEKDTADKSCNVGHLLDITLHYLVSNQQMSFKVNRERKLGANMKLYKVAEKMAHAQLDSLQLLESFLKADSGKATLIQKWEQSGDTLTATSGSVMVCFSNGKDDVKTYSWKGQSYPILGSLEEVRNHINNLICTRKTMAFTLLMDPPISEIGYNGHTPIFACNDTIAKLKKELQKLIGERKLSELRAAETQKIIDSLQIKNGINAEQPIKTAKTVQ